MPENKKITSVKWHSDAWWMRVYDKELTHEEERLWINHLDTCEECRIEWDAMNRLDLLMQNSPEVPPLPEDFTASTVQRIVKMQRFRRILSIVVGSIIVMLISLSLLIILSNAFQTLGQYLGIFFSARYLLFSSFVQIVLGLIESWRMALPFFIGLSIFIFVLLMPNSALVTCAIVWYSRRQRKQLTAI